jgi:ribosomal protein S18 acetylase RimI-like enzyme
MTTARLADFANEEDRAMVLNTWVEYAEDENAGGEKVQEEVKANLINEMQKRGTIYAFLAFSEGGKPAGVSICMEGFSTFNCKSLLNIHDFGVLATHRRKGVGQVMLEAISSFARAKGFCKITLEVLEKNKPAWDCYIKAGFAPYALNPELGWAVEMQKYLP